MFRFFRRRRRQRRKQIKRKDYLEKKEATRILVHTKLAMFNTHYGFSVRKVFIRNQRSRWGSCSIKKNLNFNYRLIYLPEHLQNYVIVHELCHLQEMNHSKLFWILVAQIIPDCKANRRELNKIEIK